MASKLPRICLLGLPSSGKGTYGALLSTSLSAPLITASTLLKQQTAADVELKKVIDGGGLVPDEVISTICEKAATPHGSYILDGYPRTAGQALDCISWKTNPVTAAVFVDVPSWVVQRKISGRLVCPGCGKGWNNVGIDEAGFDMPPLLHEGQDERCSCGTGLVRRGDDQDEQVVQARLRNYEEKTAPVIDFFEERDMLIRFTPYKGIQDAPNLEALVWKRYKSPVLTGNLSPV
mmetsp:Transcript_9116/g.18231  ORF Transcript_9116/g.18231 Transcript_9116/m.18231 type:complete len:234 (+) Transcript_9116:269-970(+)